MSSNSNNLADAWLRWMWSPTINMPGSGSLGGFNFHPYTTWEAPSLFSGNQAVEAGVYREVASPGKQLGKLIGAVLALADALKKIDPEIEQSQCIKEVRELCEDVTAVKERVEASATKRAEKVLDELLVSDPEGLKRLLEKYNAH